MERLSLFLLALLATAAAQAQPTRQAVDEAKRAARAQQQAASEAATAVRQAAAEERRLATRRVEAARRVQSAERLTGEIRDRARIASLAAAAAQAEVRERAAALRPMLPLAYRLTAWPAESLLAVPAPPEDALRGLLILQGLSRQLATEAAAFRTAEQNAMVRSTTAATEAARLQPAEAIEREAVAGLEAELTAARHRRAALVDTEEAIARRAAEAAAEARDLAGALARLERDRVRAEQAQARREAAERIAAAKAERTARNHTLPPPGRETGIAPDSVAVAPGGRTRPVVGSVMREFGTQSDSGNASGQIYGAAPHARVVSPCGGRVVFAGPFRSFGLLLIVDCGEGYHIVLAGLERLDTSPGRRLLSGEPIGVLGSGGDRGRANLYLELRHRGQAVDPRPWFTARG